MLKQAGTEARQRAARAARRARASRALGQSPRALGGQRARSCSGSASTCNERKRARAARARVRAAPAPVSEHEPAARMRDGKPRPRRARGAGLAARRQAASARYFSRSCRCVLSWLQRGDLGRLTHVEAAGASCDLSAPHLLARLLRERVAAPAHGAGAIPTPRFFPAIVAASRSWRKRRARCADDAYFRDGPAHALGYGLELDARSATGEPLQLERGTCSRSSTACAPRRRDARRRSVFRARLDLVARASARRRRELARGAAAARPRVAASISASGRCRAGWYCKTS